VRRETEGKFREVFPVDLLSAQAGSVQSSGVAAVRAALDALIAPPEGAEVGGAPADGRAGTAATVLRLQDHALSASRPRAIVTPRRITAARRPRRTSGSGGTAL
jgi:hypothetical protein